jgi:hypothetical protein
MNTCEFCKGEFSSTKALKLHIKSAKYCLQKRGQNILYKCEGCEKVVSTKHTLKLHKEKCIIFREQNLVEKYENIIKEQKKDFLEQLSSKDIQIQELQNKLENIAIKAVSKPTTVNNTNNSRVNQIINNLTPITTEHLTEHAQFLTLEHIKDGASGYAKYALEYPLKDKIICVDYARRKVKYKDEEGNLVDDPEMTKLAKKFFMAIETYNNNLLSNYNADILQKMLDVGGDNNEMTQEEADKCILLGNALFEEMVKVKSMRTDIEDIKKGNKPELYYDFVKDVCSKTTC